jgi:hypothetical protein
VCAQVAIFFFLTQRLSQHTLTVMYTVEQSKVQTKHGLCCLKLYKCSNCAFETKRANNITRHIKGHTVLSSTVNKDKEGKGTDNIKS